MRQKHMILAGLVPILILLGGAAPWRDTYLLECPIPAPQDRINEHGQLVITVAVKPSGQVFWNGTPLQKGTLPKLLAQTVSGNPGAIVHLYAPDQTPYGLMKRILLLIDRSGIRHLILGSPKEG